jgi:peptide chain release factor subunit 1
MLTETNLHELLGYQAEHQVLSVYVNIDPTQGSADVYRLNLRSMLKDINLSEDVTAVEDYFSHQYDWTGRGVVLFSCAPESFFRAYPLAIPVRNQVVLSDRPYVKPLASLLDYYGGYGVALVDKQGARLFSFHLGEITEQEGILGEDVKHTKHGGSSAKTGMRGGMSGQTRYEDELTERNFREVAEFAERFFKEHNVRRVLIGGTDDNIALLKSQLSKSWQSLIVGTFAMSMTAGKSEVLERAMQIGKQAEFRKEENLLKKLVTGAAKEQRAVLSLDTTLQALRDGRVQTLVITDGYHESAYRCQGCGYATTVEMPNCQYCGGAFSQIPDAVELVVHDIMRSGGEVEVLQQEHKVDGFTNIGALLRY